MESRISGLFPKMIVICTQGLIGWPEINGNHLDFVTKTMKKSFSRTTECRSPC